MRFHFPATTKYRPTVWLAVACITTLCGFVGRAGAEEVWLHDNSRVYGLIRGVTADGQIQVREATGTDRNVPLEEVIAIRFLGRSPLLVQSGTQEFRLAGGSRIRGQFLYNDGDLLHISTALAGPISLDLGYLRGFVAHAAGRFFRTQGGGASRDAGRPLQLGDGRCA